MTSNSASSGSDQCGTTMRSPIPKRTLRISIREVENGYVIYDECEQHHMVQKTWVAEDITGLCGQVKALAKAAIKDQGKAEGITR